jgi:hypothetical protein
MKAVVEKVALALLFFLSAFVAAMIVGFAYLGEMLRDGFDRFKG